MELSKLIHIMRSALPHEQTLLRLLEKFKIFTAFYHLSELRSREDLIKGIIENLDYSMCVIS